MNILLISSDKTLLESGDNSPSDTKERMNLISRDVSKLFIAVLTPENNEKKILKLSCNSYVYSLPCKGKNPIITIIKGYRFCSDICKNNHIDIISIQEPFIMGFIGYFLKLKYKIPLNTQIHGDFIDNSWWIKQSKSHILWNRWAKWVLKRSDTIRTVNPQIKNQLIQLGIDKNKIFDFPVFLELKKFLISNNNLNDEFKSFDNIILFVGFLIKRKAVDVLLNAIPRVLDKFPDSLFIIVGDGGERLALEKLSKKLKISSHVIFEGYIPHDKISAYYKICDLLVLPSRSESWGRVVIEAMAFEKPVIVSDACKISSMLTQTKSGLAFEVDNPHSLAQKIIFLLDNKKLSQEMGIRGKMIVSKNYSEEAIIPKYYEMWEKTLAEAKR